ncbi:MAG: VWA domain-containing protein, partial [Candidatus Krumholzibacteria bacterium]|nr:VWA domain-containing protein [Candidatus Krumholzibacteria bacterium]
MHVELWKILVAAALMAASFVLYRRTFPPIPAVRRALLAAMRIAAFILLALLLIDPVFISKRIEIRKPLVLVLLDRSRSMEIRDSSGTSRFGDALDRLERFRGALGGAKTDVEVVPFAAALSSFPLRPDSAVRADGEGTDIWGALGAAQRRYRARNLAAIVLLTDGRITRGMISSGVVVAAPVYAIGFGDTLGKADVSIDEVIADRVAYRGTKVPVEAVIRASGFMGTTIVVRLLEGEKVRDRATLSVKKDEEIISASLSYAAETEGERRLSVEALPAAGEEHSENNAESFRLDVLKDKVRILYIDQYPDWNMTFVRDLVKGSKRFEVEAVSWKVDKGFVIDPGERPWTFPAGAAGIGRYDLVIVSDDAKLFNVRSNVEALGSFVRAGGSVLFIADENSPLARTGSFDLLQSLLSLRRVSNPRIEYAESFVRISVEGIGDPVASGLAEDGGLDAMPPLPARIAGLAAAAGSRIPLVLEDRGGRTPLLVLGRCGEGLSGAILGFPLWRWKLAGEEGRRIYESFFGGLVQSMAEGAGAPALAIDPDRTVYRAGDPVKLVAYIGSRRPPEGIRGEIRKKEEGRDVPVGTVAFEPDPKRRGYYRAALDPLPPGDYAVVASEATSSGSGITAAASFSVESVSVELLDPSRDAALLAR